MKNYSIVALLAILSLILTSIAYAAKPQIQTIADQRASAGVYQYTPSLNAGGTVLWSKAYGPDDVTVDPLTGRIQWDISAALPDESYHLGVRAGNADGYDIETWIVTVGDGNVIYIGPNEPLKTLKAGMAAMSSGDTLVMRNGTWLPQDGDNTIPGSPQKLQKLPSGDAGNFTTLMAEDPGQVTLDGNGYTGGLIQMYGSAKHPDWPAQAGSFTGITNYIAIKGLVLKNSWLQGLRVEYSQHIKLIDIGVGPSALSESSYPNVYIYRSRWVTIEGLYVWGHGRYKMQFKDSSESVVRRSLVRMDDSRINDPIGGFVAYCSKNIVFQNNIVIDSNASDYWFNHNDIVGGFGMPATNCYDYPSNIVFRDGLILNSHTGIGVTNANSTDNPAIWENIVAWDLAPAAGFNGTGQITSLHSGGGPSINNMLTISEVSTSEGWYLYSRERDTTVSNSIFHRLGWNGSSVDDIGDLIRAPSAEFFFTNNNVTEFLGDTIQAGSATVVGTSSVAPQFRYITKLPDDSALRSLGTGGNGVGAELLFMRGKSNTFYGEPGYDTPLTIPMWPFPGEELMRIQMRDFSYTGNRQSGGSGTLAGVRGFTVAGQSLTHYVWTYAGTIAPPLRVSAVAEDGSATVLWDSPRGLGFTPASYRVYRTDVTPRVMLGQRAADGVNRLRIESLNNHQAVKLGVTAVASNGQESDLVYPISVTPSDGNPPVVIPEPPAADELCVIVPLKSNGTTVFCL